MSGPIEERSSLVKSGENMFDIVMRRSNKIDPNNPQSHVSLTLSVKVAPEIENFMSKLGNGEKVAVAAYGRYWQPMPPMTELTAYDLQNNVAPGTVDGTYYHIDQLGNSLFNESEGLNISFLRLVGISEGTGITIGLKGAVYSEDAIKKMVYRLGLAVRQFYIDYIRPIDSRVNLIMEAANFHNYGSNNSQSPAA